MAANRETKNVHDWSVTLEEARILLGLKLYLEETVDRKLDIPAFCSVVERELDSIAQKGGQSISSLHMDYLITENAGLGQEVLASYAKEFHKSANNGNSALLASLKSRIEMSRIVEGASKLSWEEAGAVILHIIDSARWEQTKMMLYELMRGAAGDNY